MKISRYFCPRCGKEKMLQDGVYCLCKKCKKYFMFYEIANGMFDGWNFGNPENERIAEWIKKQTPKGCLGVRKERVI